MLYLFVDGVNDHSALRRVLNQEVTRLALKVRRHLVKMRLKNHAEFCRENLVLSLVSCNLHHLHELWRGILFDLKDE